jgi:hypothetical protein
MILKEELETVGFHLIDSHYEYVHNSWEYMFNIKTQQLFAINDGYGDPELLCIITNFEELKKLLINLPQ